MVYPRYFFNIEILIVPFSTARWRSSRIRSENVPQRSLLLTTIPVVFSIPAPTISGSHNGLSKLVSCLAYGCWIISSSAMNRSVRCWRRMSWYHRHEKESVTLFFHPIIWLEAGIEDLAPSTPYRNSPNRTYLDRCLCITQEWYLAPRFPDGTDSLTYDF